MVLSLKTSITTILTTLLMSINPFLIHLSRVVSQWMQAKQGIPDVSFSRSTFLLLLGNPEVFLFWMIYNPCSELKSRSRKHPYPMEEPPQLSPLTLWIRGFTPSSL